MNMYTPSSTYVPQPYLGGCVHRFEVFAYGVCCVKCGARPGNETTTTTVTNTGE